MLQSLVNISFDTSLSLLLFRTISGNDLLGLGKVGSDELWRPERSGLCKVRVVRSTDLDREGLQGSSLHCVDCELVVGVNGGETSRNLVRKRQASLKWNSKAEKCMLLTKPLL